MIIASIAIFETTKKKKKVEIKVNQNTEIKEEPEIFPYEKKYLLTKNEWNFYKELKKIADKYNLHILAKVRIADIIDVKKGLNKSDWAKYFAKIKSKHIDFVLCNPENLFIQLLIELDDKSHEKEERKKRDVFVEKLYETTKYKLLRINDTIQLEEKICSILNLEKK